MKRQPKHHCCWPGKTVRVQLQNGELIYGKFVEERSTHIKVSIGDHTVSLRKSDLASFGINRGGYCVCQ